MESKLHNLIKEHGEQNVFPIINDHGDVIAVIIYGEETILIGESQ